MNNLLVASNAGIPLFIIEKKSYANWLNTQSQRTQNWLQNTNFSEKGLALLPNEQGELAQALFVVSNINDYFACGDLIKQLPQGQYLLNSEKDHHSAICFGWLVGAYQFDRYITNKSDKKFATLAINNADIVDNATKAAQATALTRDLVNTPAADMMPTDIAQATQELAAKFNGKVKQIIGDELLVHNYPTIHAVGRASVHTPCLIDLTWGDETNPKVTLVGKGVCFDSGGLDLKPASGMRYMKKDMGGAAHVLGLASLIMSHNLNVRLRVLIPAVENAVSSNAFRPGDVIKTRQGLTVEIDNTDAEGRLVLCDALTEASTENPDVIFDFATLTGACRVALGTELPGFFSNTEELATDLSISGNESKDPVWRLPLHKPYNDMLKSQVADTLNSAASGLGGAITAALYLQKFVSCDIPWVHFDVMAWNNRNLPGRPIGGEAFGIRAVFNYLEKRYA